MHWLWLMTRWLLITDDRLHDSNPLRILSDSDSHCRTVRCISWSAWCQMSDDAADVHRLRESSVFFSWKSCKLLRCLSLESSNHLILTIWNLEPLIGRVDWWVDSLRSGQADCCVSGGIEWDCPRAACGLGGQGCSFILRNLEMSS